MDGSRMTDDRMATAELTRTLMEACKLHAESMKFRAEADTKVAADLAEARSESSRLDLEAMKARVEMARLDLEATKSRAEAARLEAEATKLRSESSKLHAETSKIEKETESASDFAATIRAQTLARAARFEAEAEKIRAEARYYPAIGLGAIVVTAISAAAAVVKAL